MFQTQYTTRNISSAPGAQMEGISSYVFAQIPHVNSAVLLKTGNSDFFTNSLSLIIYNLA
jgi:hypothetical protein